MQADPSWLDAAASSWETPFVKGPKNLVQFLICSPAPGTRSILNRNFARSMELRGDPFVKMARFLLIYIQLLKVGLQN